MEGSLRHPGPVSYTHLGKKHLTEEAIAAGYKNRGIAPEIAKAWVDDGWGMYGLPEEYGGKPVDHQTMAMIIEELNHCGGNIPMAPNLLIMFDMVEFGTPEQIQYAIDYYKENGYPPYCLAISEPEAGSANQWMTTTATKDADGKIHINGTKTWVKMCIRDRCWDVWPPLRGPPPSPM